VEIINTNSSGYIQNIINLPNFKFIVSGDSGNDILLNNEIYNEHKKS
jgi:hypothetical protein